MTESCALQFDLISENDYWIWLISDHEKPRGNECKPLKGCDSPANLYANLIKKIPDKKISSIEIEELQEICKNTLKNILPTEIVDELRHVDNGHIHFRVSPEWASIPFELYYLPGKGFLGELFEIGTTIHIEQKKMEKRDILSNGKILIIADSLVKARQEEAKELRRKAEENGWISRYFSNRQKSKVLTEMGMHSLIHYAGHSPQDGKGGWQLDSDQVITISDMEGLGNRGFIPWLIFSNSCHAAYCGNNHCLSGVAGILHRIGVKQVIGPFCKIKDEEAEEFALLFYKNFFTQGSPAKSLMAAKIEMKQKNPNSVAHLSYRLFGDPRDKYDISQIKTTEEIEPIDNPKQDNIPIIKSEIFKDQNRSKTSIQNITMLSPSNKRYQITITIITSILLLIIFIAALYYLWPQRTISIQIPTSFAQEEKKVFGEIIELFEKENIKYGKKTISVNFDNRSVKDILTSLHSKEKFDLVTIDINSRGDIQVKEELLDLQKNRKNLLPTSMHYVVDKLLDEQGLNHLYFIPFRLNVKVLFVNKPKIEEFFGDQKLLSDDLTWQKVSEFAQECKNREGKKRVIIHGKGDEASLLLLELIRSAGGDPNNILHEFSLEAMKFLRALWPYVEPVNWQTAEGYLIPEKAYLGASWCFTLSTFEKQGILKDFKVYPGLRWKGKTRLPNLLGGDFLAMPNNAPHPKQALKFMEFLLKPKIQRKLATDLYWPPIRTDIYPQLKEKDKLGPCITLMEKALVDARPVPSWWNPEARKLFLDLFTKITATDMVIDRQQLRPYQDRLTQHIVTYNRLIY